MTHGQRRRVSNVSLLFVLLAAALQLTTPAVAAVSTGSARVATVASYSYDSSHRLSAERVSRVGKSETARIVVRAQRRSPLRTPPLTVVSGVAAEGVAGAQGPLALTRAGPKLTQQGLEHIAERHWATSGAANAGKFAEGTTGRSLKSMISDAVYKGSFRPNTMGRPGTIYEYNFGTKIGTDIGGSDTSWLRVVLGEDNTVITAFPYLP